MSEKNTGDDAFDSSVLVQIMFFCHGDVMAIAPNFSKLNHFQFILSEMSRILGFKTHFHR